MLRSAFLILLALFLAPRWAWAGADVELPFESAYGYSGGCTASGVDGGGRTVPQCNCNVDGFFYVRGFTRGLSGTLTSTSKIVRGTPRTTVPGTSADQCSIKTACTVLTNTGTHATPLFQAGTYQQWDLGTATPTVCVLDQKCSFETAGTATTVNNQALNSACLTSACTDKEFVCKFEIDKDVGTPFVGNMDFSSAKITFDP